MTTSITFGQGPDAGRSYLLHADPHPADRRPLLLVLHGWQGSAAQAEQMTGASGYADSHGFAVAYPQGLAGAWSPPGGRAAWNAGPCCGGAAADDVSYLAHVIDDAARRVPVQPDRTFVVGFSNGGMMAWRLGCSRPDLVAGIGSVAGPLLQPCAPVAALHAVQLYGTVDQTVPPAGGWSAYCRVGFPSTVTEAGRVGPGVRLDLTAIPGLGHAWPTPGDNAMHLDGMATLWTSLNR